MAVTPAQFQTLIPAMRYLGVHNIDVAMAHSYQDHVAGVMELLSIDMVRHLVIGNETVSPRMTHVSLTQE